MYTRWAFKNKKSDGITKVSQGRALKPRSKRTSSSTKKRTHPFPIPQTNNDESVASPIDCPGATSRVATTASMMRMEKALLGSTRGENFSKIAKRNPIGWLKIVQAQLEHEKFLQSMHFYDHGPLLASTRPSFQGVAISDITDDQQRFHRFQIPWRKGKSKFISPSDNLKKSFEVFRKDNLPPSLPRTPTPPQNDSSKPNEFDDDEDEDIDEISDSSLTRDYTKSSIAEKYSRENKSISAKLDRISYKLLRPPPYICSNKADDSPEKLKRKDPMTVVHNELPSINLLTQSKKSSNSADDKQLRDGISNKTNSISTKENNYLVNKLRFGVKYGGKKPPGAVDDNPMKIMQQKFLNKEHTRKDLSKEFGELIKSGYFGTLVSSTASSTSSPPSITPNVKSNAGTLMLPVSQLLPVCISSPYKRQTVFIRDYMNKEAEAQATAARSHSRDVDELTKQL